MEKASKHRISPENRIPDMKADERKARLVSGIIEKGEQGDEEENRGRS